MRKRRVQAVLLCEKLREVFVVVLHFHKSNLGCRRLKKEEAQEQKTNPGGISFSKKQKHKKRVFHLCNYGVARIRCAVGAVHVAQRRLRCCGRMLRSDFTRLARLSPCPPQSSSRHRWHTGTEADGRKKRKERDRGTAIRLGPAEVSSAAAAAAATQGRSSHTPPPSCRCEDARRPQER